MSFVNVASIAMPARRAVREQAAPSVKATPYGMISITAAGTAHLGNPAHVLVLVDVEGKRIRIEPCAEDAEGKYKLSYTSSKTTFGNATISAVRVLAAFDKLEPKFLTELPIELVEGAIEADFVDYEERSFDKKPGEEAKAARKPTTATEGDAENQIDIEEGEAEDEDATKVSF